MGTTRENDARGKSRNENNRKWKKTGRKLEKRNIITNDKSPKQGLTSAKVLTIELNYSIFYSP